MHLADSEQCEERMSTRWVAPLGLRLLALVRRTTARNGRAKIALRKPLSETVE